MTEQQKRRPIRSYVLRTGRMTQGQQRGFDDNWRRVGLRHSDGQLDIDAAFTRGGPRVLEIGFGMGQSLVAMAQAAPQTNFIGIEVHKPGVGKLLHSMAESDVDNIRVYCHDAVEVLASCIENASLDTIQIFFPDPWHKKKHHKRRLIQAPLVTQLVSKLKADGVLHLATDWENYAEQMMKVLSQNTDLQNAAGVDQFSPRPGHRPHTKFETRGERLGHSVWDLVFTRV